MFASGSHLTLTSVNTTDDAMERALLNDLVLRNIFENLHSQDDLRNCRLICTKWNLFALKQIQKNNWRDRIYLKFQSRHDLFNFIDTFRNVPENIPFSCFHFKLLSGERLLLSFTKWHLLTFLQTFPNRFKNLDIASWFKSVGEIHQLLTLQKESLIELKFSLLRINDISTDADAVLLLPKLDYLSLSHYQQDRQKNIVFPIILKFFINIIPKETIIKVVKPRNLEGVMEVLQTSNRIKSIIGLDISDTLFNRALLDSGLQLQYLKLNGFRSRRSYNRQSIREDVYGFLSTQANCLETLSYENNVFKLPVYPTMKVLRCLTLKCALQEYGPQQLPQPILFDFFPNLKILKISGKSLLERSYVARTFPPQASCSTLKTLNIDGTEICHGFISRISPIFPNIISLILRCHVSHEVDERVIYYQIWKSSFAATLEELDLAIVYRGYPLRPRNNFEIDSILAGVSAAAVDQISEKKTFLSQNFDRPQYNSILKLTNLAKLTFRKNKGFEAELNPWTLQDFSAYCLFGKMMKLKCLFIRSSSHNFSEGALEFLAGRSITLAEPE